MLQEKSDVLSGDFPFDLSLPSPCGNTAAISKAKNLDTGRKETGKDASGKEREKKNWKGSKEISSLGYRLN